MTSTLGIKKIQYPNGTNSITIDSSGSAAIITNATVGGTLGVTGNTTLSGELAVDTNTLKVQASDNRVGIGTGSPNYARLNIASTAAGAQERGLYIELTPASGTSPNNIAVFSATNSNMTQPLVRIHHESPTADQLMLQCTTTGSNTVKFSVDEDGDIYSAGGINLGGTGTANQLDDYEEGTFTPTWNGYPSPHATSGSYTKIGRQVIVYTELVTSNSQDFSEVQIDNLPFTISGNRGGGFVYHNQTGLYPYTPLTVMNANTTGCKLKTVVGAGNEVGVKYVDSGQPTLGGYTTLRWTIFYETS